MDEPSEDPVRVCPKCSTQSRTAGEFCPHCGASFVRGRRKMSRKAKRILAAIAVLVLAGAGTATAMKISSDKKAERERKAQIAEEREEQERREEAAARAEEEEREAQEALDDIERDARKDLEKGLRKSIKEDAEEKVAEGLLDGPVLSVSCDPVGGGRDDLTSRTGKYDCLAVTEISGSGTMRGYSYHGTINYKKFSWSWGLGD
jgi:cell division protein FtsB